VFRVPVFRCSGVPGFTNSRLIAPEKITIADVSIILERSQKCVIEKIEVKMLGKNQNGAT
jgi:hypothetical protein